MRWALSLLSAAIVATTAAQPQPLAKRPEAKRSADPIATLRVVSAPPATYSGDPPLGANRAPLAPSPLTRLPFGSIEPRGWLRTQLKLQAAGMVGAMEELSPWCRFERSAWTSPTGEGEYGWEEMPYWLKGYTAMACVLKDRAHMARARRWLEAILASQREDGYFGPEENRRSMDLWPNMLVLSAMQVWHEATGDRGVLDFMHRYFRWQERIPEGRFLFASWQHVRGGDNLESIFWLYNRRSESWLLDLARRNHECTAPWSKGIASFHGVNFAQGFREPAQYAQLSRSPLDLQAAERNYRTMRLMYGQVPGGMYGADENARPGYTGPRQGTETCAFVEMMYSCEVLACITGSVRWADRCEDVALNSFPASLTPDLKALHYLTAPNQVILDRSNKSPMIQNGGDMFSYTPYEQYRCCQHNVAFGWPYYAAHLWTATSDGGFAALLYAPCVADGKTNRGHAVRLAEETEYPFGDTIRITVQPERPARFPLYLRVPGWCSRPVVTINGRRLTAGGNAAGKWIVLEREWRKGDRVSFRLPMAIRVTRWTGNRNTVSVHRGPLTYSLRIAERWVRYDTGRARPGWEVWPASAWNYGLVLDSKQPEKAIRVERVLRVKDGEQVFRSDRAPITLKARARLIPEWRLEPNRLVAEVQAGPIRSREKTVEVTLVPMGCARLRISAFPWISDSRDAREWPQPALALDASWVWPFDTLSALTDGILPRSSADTSIPRFTWWDHVGTTEWVQLDLREPRRIAACSVYWFDDEAVGGRCRLPASWRVLYVDGGGWREVVPRVSYTVEKDAFSTVRFDPITARQFRVEATLKPGFSGGILELRLQSDGG